MSRQLHDRLTKLEAVERQEEISIERIVIGADGVPDGFMFVRQPDGTWKQEPYTNEDE